ncbi:hypothetical protein [Streptomyces sp. NBC_00358]|uniref:hypothetical protein n=1 Tax=Streptomyces sp. NBC_00358 TaxID=2975725 RepID=UPI002E275497
MTGATVTGSAAAFAAAAPAAATSAALAAAWPTSGVLLVATTTAAAVSATLAAVSAAVTAVTAVVDAAVPEVAGVAAALTTETTPVTPAVTESAVGAAAPEAVTKAAAGTAVTKAAPEPAVTEATVGTAAAEAAVTEAAVGTAAAAEAAPEPAVTEAATGTASTESAEVTHAAVGTPVDMPPEPAEACPGLVLEPSVVTELTELTEPVAHIDRRLLAEPPAEQALGAGGRDVEAAGALVAGDGKGQVGRVVDGGRIPRHMVGGDIRNVVVCQRVCRAPEEQGRLGQARVERCRSTGGAGLDAQGAEFADLRGCQAQSSGHLLGVTVEFGPEGRVDGKAGHGIAKGVVGHVLGSPWVCVRC